MKGARLVTLVVLVFWVLLGPVGMALSGCMMMDGCDALCGVQSVVLIVATALSTQTTSVLVPSGVAFSSGHNSAIASVFVCMPAPGTGAPASASVKTPHG